ncbi:amine oxidase [flavin-containing] A-like [Amphiura filiformis]|uniref:amine oxidase [flavin-containing] A-like n=1 Tax=Amphiura filiformis TaxID=82378 RepID=UPI003B2166D6
MAEVYDVVIIGAGLSGLVAAYTVLKQIPSAKVVVLESTDHIGGPIVCRDMKTADGTGVFDLGSARVGTAQTEMLEFIKELGLETYEQYGTGNKFWQLGDGKMKKWSGNIPPLPYTSLLDLLRFFKKVDSLSKEVNLENPAASKHAEEWDKTTMEEFRKNVLWTEVGRQTADTLTGSFFSMDIKELKLMSYLYVVASDGGWDNHSDKESSRKLNLKVKGGFGKVCTELVQKISESSVLKNESVTSIALDGEKSAVVKTSSGKEFTAKRVICAAAINHVGGIQFDPPLKIERAAAFPKVIPMINCALTYSTPFWREDGLAGELLSMSGTLSLLAQNDDHPVIGVFDHNNSDSKPALMAVLGAPGLHKKTADQRKGILLNYMKEHFGEKAMEPLDYQELIWDTDYRGPAPKRDGVKPSEVLSALRTPHGCVHWAGSYTATSWNDSLAGALQAGQRAANEVVAAMK